MWGGQREVGACLLVWPKALARFQDSELTSVSKEWGWFLRLPLLSFSLWLGFLTTVLSPWSGPLLLLDSTTALLPFVLHSPPHRGSLKPPSRSSRGSCIFIPTPLLWYKKIIHVRAGPRQFPSVFVCSFWMILSPVCLSASVNLTHA